jgi:hypothetical protein
MENEIVVTSFSGSLAAISEYRESAARFQMHSKYGSVAGDDGVVSSPAVATDSHKLAATKDVAIDHAFAILLMSACPPGYWYADRIRRCRQSQWWLPAIYPWEKQGSDRSKSHGATLTDLGIPKDRAGRAMQLADVPQVDISRR